jgi:hypothetical protein
MAGNNVDIFINGKTNFASSARWHRRSGELACGKALMHLEGQDEQKQA